MRHIVPDHIAKAEEINTPIILDTNHPLENNFNLQELTSVLKGKKKYTAPGSDQITYNQLLLSRIIKNLPEQALIILLNIYNAIWNNIIYIPPKWKQIKIIALLKPDKDKTNEKSYRPISLISVFMKIMNTMIKNRLESLVEKQKIVSPTQYGFRKHRGCGDYLLNLILDIETARTSNETFILTALDISRANDNVNLPFLFRKMYIYGIPKKFIIHCQKWLVDRTQTLFTDNESISRRTNQGIPQGSTLSPLLFAIYLSQINESFPIGVMSLQYADDISLYTSHKNIDISIGKIQEALTNIITLSTEMQLKLSIEKCKVIVITRKKVNNNNLNLNVEGYRISVEDRIKNPRSNIR